MAIEAPVLAMVSGQPLMEMPKDLFIPPDALEVLLDSFTGPLDLLLYLIREQDFDILDIPIALITKQYMQYIEWLEQRRLELAADYLVMAALLAEIKSRLLLPSISSLQEDIEEDPRMELVRRLQAYEQFKQAAIFIDQLPRLERDVFRVSLYTDHVILPKAHPDLALSAVVIAMMALIKRQDHVIHHQISRERLSVRERMSMILSCLHHQPLIELSQLLNKTEGRMGLVVTLLAILELAKQSLIKVTQSVAYSLIHIQANENG